MTLAFKRISAAVVALLLIAALSAAGTLNAQDSSQSGSGLRISPTRSELNLVPGDSRVIVQTVKNVTSADVIVEPLLNDFESNGVTGEPLLIGDQDDISAYSLREFIEVPEPFELGPGEEREVSVAIIVPENASPGAYFGSMLYQAAPKAGDGDGQVALKASVGSLILLEVPGDITEKIQINDISAFLNDSSGSLFTKKPDNIGLEIENLGNSFSQPFGKVKVTDWRGNEVFLYELNDTTPRGNILPDSTRLFLDELNDIEEKTVNGEIEVTRLSPITWPGRYTVTGNISHGTTGEIFTVSSTFWYIPVWLILVLIGIALALVGSALYLYRKYVTKSTNRRR